MSSLPSTSGETTRLLQRLQGGDPAASDALLNAVYAELHRLAASHMSRQPDHHTLQVTALVHEAWLRLVDRAEASYENRKCFFAMASRVMRNLLVDHARSRRARPDGAPAARISLAEHFEEGGRGPGDFDLLALDDALEALGSMDPELLRVVELRFFGGLTSAESAEILGMPLRSFERALQVARLWLGKRLSAG